MNGVQLTTALLIAGLLHVSLVHAISSSPVSDVEEVAEPQPEEDETDSTKEPTFCEQGISLPLNPDKNRTKNSFHIPWSPRNSRCQWTIAGSANCVVELSCSIDIPDTSDQSSEEMTECKEEYLKVSDGSFGFIKFCGKQHVSKIQPNKGLSDLFVMIEASPTALKRDEDEYYGRKKFRGAQCFVQCGDPEEDGIIRPPKNIKRRVDNRCICGLQTKSGNRIVGGEDASFMEFPWQAAVVEEGTRFPECGASVINSRFVLSAAHCFVPTERDADEVEVLVHAFILDQTKMDNARDVALGKKGSIRSSGYNLSAVTDKDEKTQRYKVLKIINHPLFDKYYDFDYALLQVDGEININGQKRKMVSNDQITPVCLPPRGSTFKQQLSQWKNQNNTNLTVVGWGKATQNAGGSTRILQKLNVPFIPRNTCNTYLPNRLTDRMICAGYEKGKMDACTGDSGGPLTYKNSSTQQYRQVGVVSWGLGCAKEKKPGIYSKVRDAMQWIHFHTQMYNSQWCKESY